MKLVIKLSLVLLTLCLSATQVSAAKEVTPELKGARNVASDTDKDGKPDQFEYYDAKNMLVKVEADRNGDGRIDEWGTVENNKVVKLERDTDFDGKVDKWIS